jgi:hypothetical protein
MTSLDSTCHTWLWLHNSHHNHQAYPAPSQGCTHIMTDHLVYAATSPHECKLSEVCNFSKRAVLVACILHCGLSTRSHCYYEHIVSSSQKFQFYLSINTSLTVKTCFSPGERTAHSSIITSLGLIHSDGSHLSRSACAPQQSSSSHSSMLLLAGTP